MSSQLEELKKEFQIAEYNLDFDRLHTLCDKILEHDPNLIEYKQYIAISYFLSEDYENCIKEYSIYLDRREKDADDAYILAMSHLHLNNESEAMSIIEGFDEIDSLELKLKAYHEIKHYYKAIKAGNELLDLDSSNEEALQAMSEIYDELNNTEMSLFYEWELCKLKPSIKGFHLMRLYELGRYDEVIEIFERDPNDFVSHLLHYPFNFLIGSSYCEIGRHMDALKYLYRSNQLHECRDTGLQIARNYYMLKDYEMAYKILKGLVVKEGLLDYDDYNGLLEDELDDTLPLYEDGLDDDSLLLYEEGFDDALLLSDNETLNDDSLLLREDKTLNNDSLFLREDKTLEQIIDKYCKGAPEEKTDANTCNGEEEKEKEKTEETEFLSDIQILDQMLLELDIDESHYTQVEEDPKYFKETEEDSIEGDEDLDIVDANILRMMSEICLYLKRYDECLMIANRLLSVSDRYDEIVNVMSAYYLEMEDGWKAEEWFMHLPIALAFNKPFIYTIARNLSLIGENDRALKIYNTIEGQIDGSPYLLYERACLYKRIGEKELAMRDLDRYNDIALKYLYENGEPEVKYDDLE